MKCYRSFVCLAVLVLVISVQAQTPVSQSGKSGGSNGQNDPLNYDNFQKIDFDMSYEQVKEILGAEGNRNSDEKNGRYRFEAYEWKNDKSARILVRFENGKLVSKSQSGMTGVNGTADLSVAKFNQITDGMSYRQVLKIIGSEGEVTATAKNGDRIVENYSWKGPKSQRITAVFSDDELSDKSQAGLVEPNGYNTSIPLSREKFNRIELDMSYEQVTEIVGSEGQLTSSTKTGEAYQWKGDKNARISARFQNGKLVSKSQTGITGSGGIAELTLEKYELIQIGMAYEVIAGIIGSAGELTTMSKFGDVISTSYVWKGQNYQRLFVSFRDDKLESKSHVNLIK